MQLKRHYVGHVLLRKCWCCKAMAEREMYFFHGKSTLFLILPWFLLSPFPSSFFIAIRGFGKEEDGRKKIKGGRWKEEEQRWELVGKVERSWCPRPCWHAVFLL